MTADANCPHWRDYDALTPAELVARLRAAEDVCVLFGWAAAPERTERGRALLQAWMDWYDLPNVTTDRRANPDIDERIAELARRRDAAEARTRARIHGDEVTA